MANIAHKCILLSQYNSLKQDTIETVIYWFYFKTNIILPDDGFQIKPKYTVLIVSCFFNYCIDLNRCIF